MATQVETSLRAYLVAQSEITDIVSTRIFRGHIPQGVALPAISYRNAGYDQEFACDGPQDLADSTIEFHLFASTSPVVENLAEQLRLVLSAIDRETVGTHNVQYCKLDNQVDAFEDPEAAKDTVTWHMVQFWVVAHNLAIPA